jgi:mannobiose 2-epimerase
MSIPLTTVLLVLFSGGSVRAQQTVDHLALAEELEHHLLTDLAPRWFPRVIDRAGGFHQGFARDWEPTPVSARFTVYQARVTWVAAELARHDPDRRENYRAATRHGLAYLRQHLWDAQHGGFFWTLPMTPDDPLPHDGQKHLYAQAFGIYAAANAYRATGDDAALRLAREAVEWVEQHAPDRQHGGYHESLNRAGVPLLGPVGPAAEVVNVMRTPLPFKTMNSHIHLLEAYTELQKAAPTPHLAHKLRDLRDLLLQRMYVQPGTMNLYYTRDWRPVPAECSFGHDVETAFLLLEATRVLGEPEHPATRHAAQAMVDHALALGWDTEHGGFFNAGDAIRAAPDQLDKVWWVQAEGLHTLPYMAVRYPESRSRYLQAMVQQWQFMRRHQIDPVHGGWFGEVAADGIPSPGSKLHPWRAGYHTTRALVSAARSLRELAGHDVAGPDR